MQSKHSKKNHVIIIGAGITGMALSALLRVSGYEVTLLERQSELGGRARKWEKNGFTFDMGPSWYLMPEVFERFFALLGRDLKNYYRLRRLDPAYRVFFDGYEEPVDIRSEQEYLEKLFEGFEIGGASKLRAYLADAETKYRIAMQHFLYRDYRSFGDFLNPRTTVQGLGLGAFTNLHRHVSKYFSDHRAVKILEYAMVFLGSAPKKTPSLYSIMSHVDLVQGVFFPEGGITSLIKGLEEILGELGVCVRNCCEACSVLIEGNRAIGLRIEDANPDAWLQNINELQAIQHNFPPKNRQTFLPENGGSRQDDIMYADLIVSCADYFHSDQELLPEGYGNYRRQFWSKATIAPSMFILYLGISKKLRRFRHHNLFFSSEWDAHFTNIFDKPSWPNRPSFYFSSTSFDDPSMSPLGKENIFVLVPIAAGLEANTEYLNDYRNTIIAFIEKIAGESVMDCIEVERIYSARDFQNDYNAYKGTALGLAHTLGQTAIFRPAMRNRKLQNFFYAGQYTHPGIGLPMCLISAEILSGIIGRPL